MMFKFKKLIFSILTIFSCTLVVLAESTPTEQDNNVNEKIDLKTLHIENKSLALNLNIVASLTEKQNLDYAISKSQKRQYKDEFIGSFAPFLPSVGFNNSVEFFDGAEVIIAAQPLNADRTTFRLGINADYSVQTGGKDIFRMLSAKKRFNRAKYSIDRVFQEALAKSTTEYYTWLRDIEAVNVASQSLQEAKEQRDILNLRLKNGFATKLEVLQAETELSSRTTLLLKSQGQKHISGRILAAELDIPFSTEITAKDLGELRPLNLIDDAKDLNAHYEIALKNRPDIKELTETVAEAKSILRESVADLFPTLSVSGFIREIGESPSQLEQTKQALVTFNIDVLRNLGLGKTANILVSREKLQQAILNKEKQINEMEKKLATAYYEFMLYKEQVGVARKKIDETSEAYRIALVRMKNGVGINLDVIKAQTDLTEAKLEYLTSVMKYNTSQIQLLKENGTLTLNSIMLYH